MSRFFVRTLLVGFSLALFSLLSCQTGGDDDDDDKGGGASPNAPFAFTLAEERFDQRYLRTPIALVGRVVDEQGQPVVDATVKLIGWGAAAGNDGVETTTDVDGFFRVSQLLRRSVLVQVSLADHYDELVPADLHQPLAESEVDIGRIGMVARRAGRARLIFAGDVMFGRRYVDRDEDGTEGEPEDLIQPGSRAEDAIALFDYIRPLLFTDDHTSVNFESPVFDALTHAPHPLKEFVFFSYTETIAAFEPASIESISLGNNHQYDYLTSGVEETLEQLADIDVGTFGLGLDEAEARATLYRPDANGVPLALQGFNGVLPLFGVADGWEDDLLYPATATKAGPYFLSHQNIEEFVEGERDARFTVPVMHSGLEYGQFPTQVMRSRMIVAIANGADLVVAHHPHTFYGIGVVPGPDGLRYSFLSLGNLVFDQDVFETFQSAVAVVDVEQTGPGDFQVEQIRLVPLHLERYVPKLLCGARAERFSRYVGHISTYLPQAADPGDPADGMEGAICFPSNGRTAVVMDPTDAERTTRTDTLTLPLSDGQTAPIPVERADPAEMLAGVQTDRTAGVKLGRELMLYGGFEDYDVDADFHEGDLWNQSDSRYVANQDVRSGIGALALLRRSSNVDAAASWLKNRVTFAPDADLTLTGWVKGQGAGEFRLEVRWYVRDERTIITTQEVYVRTGGSYGWEPFSVDLVPPANAGTVRAFFRHLPPAGGEGVVLVDDVALIHWEDGIANASGVAPLPTPNNWSYLRVTAGSSTVGVDLTLDTWRLPEDTP